MAKIATVLGDISPDELGFCQPHEHLGIANGYPASIFPHQRIDDPGLSGKELSMYRACGGRAIVDAQPLGCCRDINVLARASAASGVHIIASTGFHKLLFYPEDHWIHKIEADRLTRLFLDELNTGMFEKADTCFPSVQSGQKAGQIKAALDSENLTPRYQRLFYAAACACAESGAALMVHIEANADPIALADYLERRGVNLERLIFCHMDRAIADLSIHKEICSRKITVEYDTIGREKYHDDTREIQIISEMLAAGFEKQIMLSLDTTRDRLESYGGTPGLCHIVKTFLPMLRSAGVASEQIDSFFIENPARAFERISEIC